MYNCSDHTFAICAYGDSPYLRQCVSSLLGQTVKSRVILCTSTPSDYIDSVARNYGIALYIRNGASDIAADWNFAVSCADAKLVTIAHQDDVYVPSYLEKALQGLNDCDQLPLIYFSGYGELRDGECVVNSSLLRIKRMMLAPFSLKTLRGLEFVKRSVLAFGNPICCPAVTYVLDAMPLPIFTEGFRSNIDWDAWEKLSKLDGSFIFDNYVGMYHRVHSGSETSACILSNTRTEEDLQMLKRFWPDAIARFINRFYSRAQASN